MTRLFGVIGHPIQHSLSPAMHAAAIEALRLDALYAPFDVPRPFLKPMLEGLLLAGVEGLNVTVPLKEAILPLLDRVDSSARAIGAVNAVAVRAGRSTGYNTDGIGFRRALEELGWRPRAGRFIVLGAGGAARAVARELARWRGSRLTIANRHPERAHALAAWLRRQGVPARVDTCRLRDVSLDGAALLVNATTLGMCPSDPMPVPARQLRRGLVVYDLVYHRTTPLVQAARRRGCLAANGLSMLLYQGVASLELWLGRRPPIDAMRQALHSRLIGRRASRLPAS